MDLSKFSDSEFEVKDWVNGALRAHKDTQTPVDVRKELNLPSSFASRPLGEAIYPSACSE